MSARTPDQSVNTLLPDVHGPRAMFFDLDGTLLDSLPGIAFSIEHAFSVCNLAKSPLDLRTAIGPPIRTILARCAIDPAAKTLDLLETAFRLSYDTDGWQRTIYFPGAKQMLVQAHTDGIQLYVVSNKPRHIALKILEREDLLPLFHEILTRDSTKPQYDDKHQMVKYLLNKFQLEASRCVMIGDTLEDAEAASSALVPFVWITHGYGEVSDRVPVAHRIDSFKELLPALNKEFTK